MKRKYFRYFNKKKYTIIQFDIFNSFLYEIIFRQISSIFRPKLSHLWTKNNLKKKSKKLTINFRPLSRRPPVGIVLRKLVPGPKSVQHHPVNGHLFGLTRLGRTLSGALAQNRAKSHRQRCQQGARRDAHRAQIKTTKNKKQKQTRKRALGPVRTASSVHVAADILYSDMCAAFGSSVSHDRNRRRWLLCVRLRYFRLNV